MEETSKTIQSIKSIFSLITNVQFRGRVLSPFLCVILRASCVVYFLVSVVRLPQTFFSSCCISHVSQGCSSVVRNPVPDSEEVQYDCTQRQKLHTVLYLIPTESTSSLNQR